MSAVSVDVSFQGINGLISSYWIDGLEPLLVDPGPSTSLEGLEQSLEELGVKTSDICHILLTHIHLDHAGGVGHLVSRNPQIQVHLHPEAVPYLIDPRRLVESTRRTFRDSYDRLWGDVLPIDSDRICVWESPEKCPVSNIRSMPTPGHVGHHVSYLEELEGCFLAGDALGVIFTHRAPIYPPTPPPGVDVPIWLETLKNIEEIGPESFGIAHFGIHHDFEVRVLEMREKLLALHDRVCVWLDNPEGFGREEFEKEIRPEMSKHLPANDVNSYFDVFPPVSDWDGMQLYLERKNLKKS